MRRLGVGLIVGLAVVTVCALFVLPPIRQDASYHQFADQRTVLGVPNFWNVISNLAFLVVALWGVRALRSREAFVERWERVAYSVLLAGLAMIAFGSVCYHWSPNDATLVWDRLPMAVVFMALLATTIGERIAARAGRLLLAPLVLLGVASVLGWSATGDLRLYGAVQHYPMVALPLMLLLFPPRYTGAAGVWAMVGLYGVAKLLEVFDHQLAAITAAGGHPWKHVAAALAMLCYVATVTRRRRYAEGREAVCAN